MKTNYLSKSLFSIKNKNSLLGYSRGSHQFKKKSKNFTARAKQRARPVLEGGNEHTVPLG